MCSWSSSEFQTTLLPNFMPIASLSVLLIDLKFIRVVKLTCCFQEQKFNSQRFFFYNLKGRVGDGFCYFLQVEEEVLVVKTQNNKFQEVFYMFLFIKKIVGNIHYFTVLQLHLSQAYILLDVLQRNLTIKVNIHHHLLFLPCLMFGRPANAPFNTKGTPSLLKIIFQSGQNKAKQQETQTAVKQLASNLSISTWQWNTDNTCLT